MVDAAAVYPQPAVRDRIPAALVFAHTVGEFGVVLMLGGNIPGATRTLSIVLYNQVENFDYAAANRTAAILLGLSAIALAAIYLGRSEQSIQHLIFSHELPVVRVGRRVHLDRRDLDAWIEKNKY